MQLRFVAVATLGLAAACLLAQTPTASLVASVLDSSGGLVPGAAIEVRNTDTNQVRKAVSGHRGEVVIPNLMPGPYEIAISKEGFRPRRVTGIVLELDQVARLDLRLEVGSIASSVEVTASAAPLINTENSSKGEVMGALEIAQMPLDGHDFTDLALLAPGVLPRQEGLGGAAWTANGSRTDGNNFLIDGFANMNPRSGDAHAQPNLESLQEFKLQTSGYSAEYGRQGGGVLTMALKTGGNQPHGALFEFLRNDFFDARNFFDREKAKLRRNQFGAQISGPVLIPKLFNGRDRTFFMFSWESYRQTQGRSRLGVTPTAAQEAGDFSAGAPIKDPLATGACGAAGGAACFPGNRIPASRMSPIALALQGYYPEPNLPGQVNNYFDYANVPTHWDSFVIKLDERITDNDSLSFRFTKRYSRSENPFGGSPNMRGFATTGTTPKQMAGLTYTRIVAPSVTNEARAGFARSLTYSASVHQGRDFSREFGLPASSNPLYAGFPSVTITGFNKLGDPSNFPRITADTSIHVGDTLTMVRGTHLIKLGGELVRNRFNEPFWNAAYGSYVIGGFWTGNAYADFLLGTLNTSTRTISGTTLYMRQATWGAFAQDDWKVSRRLTLNLGFRYDVSAPFYEKYGRTSNFIPGLNMLAIGSREAMERTGIVFPATLAAPASELGVPAIAHTNYSDIAPRVGFAWRPFGGNRTVIRSGYGIFYSGFQMNTLKGSFLATYPWILEQTFTRGTNPMYLTLANPFPAPLNLVATRSSFTLVGYEVNQSTPYLQSWNFTVEREFKSSAVEVSYMGSKGTHLNLYNNINQADRITAVQAYPGMGAINYYFFQGNSSYNAGSVALRRRFTRGFFYNASYTFSKTIDNASLSAGSSSGGSNGIQNIRCLRCDRGRADWDIPHVFTMNFSWLAPFRNRLVRGWQLAGSGRAYSGFGFTPRLSAPPTGTVRPDRIAKGTVPNPTVERWYDVSAFPAPPRSAWGNAARNILDAPGKIDINFNLSKNFKIGEKGNLQFRWELFNAVNRANFNMPVRDVDVANAATITSAAAGRSLQFALRYSF